MRWSRRVVLLTSLLFSSASALAAQSVAVRHGIWLGAGVGMGSARLDCTICKAGRDGGGSGYLRIGTTITPRLLIGAEATAWYHSDSGVDFLLGSVQAVLLMYPMRASGFYIKTGLGVSQYSAKDSQNKVSSQALAGSIGIGYEVRAGRTLSLVPFANFLGTSGADVRFNDSVADLSAHTSLIQVGVGITLH